MSFSNISIKPEVQKLISEYNFDEKDEAVVVRTIKGYSAPVTNHERVINGLYLIKQAAKFYPDWNETIRLMTDQQAQLKWQFKLSSPGTKNFSNILNDNPMIGSCPLRLRKIIELNSDRRGYYTI
ncbi:MAG: hypothetical protein JHC93_01820 [Parachlamydiales bacterium]|nr:hypothetical protein [Parachlamydiales bacterium]